MSRQNRRKDSFVLEAPAAALVGLALVVAALALAYLWIHSRCEALGRNIKKLETERDELERQFQIEESKWTQLKSPRNLERTLAARGIAMNWPRPDQIVHVFEPEELDGAGPAESPSAALSYVGERAGAIHD
jgi:hypothetical protein